jgi:hypothetical protein
MFEFIDAKTVAVIFHLFGVALGAGGAFMSDAMFFKTIEDLAISTTEIRFLKLGSKITIVVVIAINGIMFHRVHMRRLIAHVGHPEQAIQFFSESKFLFMSGAVSVVSWMSTIILGAFKSIPYSYGVIVGVYVALVVLATLFAQIIRKKYLKKAQGTFLRS